MTWRRVLVVAMVVVLTGGCVTLGCASAGKPSSSQTVDLTGEASATITLRDYPLGPSDFPWGAVDYDKRTVANFQKIRRDMSIGDVLGLVGAPDADAGSGLWVLFYQLEDGSTVTVSTTGFEVLGVMHNGEALLR